MESVVANPPLIWEEVLPESLRLHTTLPMQTAAKHSHYHCIQPKNAISRTGAISFEILVGNNKFTDVGSRMLYVESSVRTAQSEMIPSKIAHPTDATRPNIVNPKVKTVPMNGIGHTIFNNIKVSLNGTQIDSGSTLYPYRGDFEMRLSYPQRVKDGCLDMIGFDKEVVSFKDITDVNMQWEILIDEALIPDASNHPQLACQFVNSMDSQTMHIMTPIHSEIFDQNKWLPPHSKLYISMEQNSSNFALMNKEGGIGEHPLKVEIEKCELLAHMIEVDSSVMKEIENVSYEGSSMLFPLQCVKME